jgi:hypothetical protein
MRGEWDAARCLVVRDELRGCKMERELWSREDLKNAILATYYAGVFSQPATDNAGAAWYAEGFRAALSALALHFGLPPRMPAPPESAPGSRPAGRQNGEKRVIG